MISAKKRFSILHRDGFRCQYCGKNGKDVTLEIDHITPISKGGGDDMDNLITSCRECNIGKSDSELGNMGVNILQINKNTLKEQLKKYFYTQWNIGRKGFIEKKTIALIDIYLDYIINNEHIPIIANEFGDPQEYIAEYNEGGSMYNHVMDILKIESIDILDDWLSQGDYSYIHESIIEILKCHQYPISIIKKFALSNQI